MIKTLFYPVIAALLLLGGCKNKASHKPEDEVLALSVKTENVQSKLISDEVAVSGNIEGHTTVKLGFMVAGKIDHISIKEGENISRGQLISSLDQTNYAIAKGLADVQLNNVSDEYNRLQIMRDRGSLSENDFSKISFSLQQAKLQQQLQQKYLSDTKLYSPISGVLLRREAEVGEIVSIGIPLFTVADIHRVKMLAFVPEGELHEIRIGQLANVTISSLGKTFTGKVTEVGSAAEATSRAFTIKIEIENPALLIRPGMIADARIATNNNKQVILLPVECIQRDLANQNFVFVIDKAQNKVFERKISLGNIIDNKIVITSGLNEGDLVVTGGQTNLTDGALVSITQ